jgi:hypothetical protein
MFLNSYAGHIQAVEVFEIAINWSLLGGGVYLACNILYHSAYLCSSI